MEPSRRFSSWKRVCAAASSCNSNLDGAPRPTLHTWRCRHARPKRQRNQSAPDRVAGHTASLANCSPKGCMASQNVAWVGIHGDDPRSCRLGTRGMPRLVGSVRIARAHAMDRFDGHGVEVIEVVEVALSSTEGSQSVEEGSHPEGWCRPGGQGRTQGAGCAPGDRRTTR